MSFRIRRSKQEGLYAEFEYPCYPSYTAEFFERDITAMCSSDVISSLVEGKEVECIIISKERLESFENAMKIATGFETLFTE